MSFNENSIRPTSLKAACQEAMQTDLDRLSQVKDEFVHVNCPSCGKSVINFAFEKFGFLFESCRNCSTVYMNPRATPNILSDFYSNSALYKYWNDHVFPASRSTRIEKIFRPRLNRIQELCKTQNLNENILVEVGAAGGMFCQEALANSQFKRVIAIEPSSSQAETCRSLGIEVIESTLDGAIDLQLNAQVVVSFETIEHVFSPSEFINQCRQLLCQNGLLVLTCPNYLGFEISTLGIKSDSLDAEHINMFNPASLRLLVNHAGFEIIELTTPGQLDADIVRRKVLDGSFSLDDQPFLHDILIDHWDSKGQPFQKFLQQHLMSSHMWLVAAKK